MIINVKKHNETVSLRDILIGDFFRYANSDSNFVYQKIGDVNNHRVPVLLYRDNYGYTNYTDVLAADQIIQMKITKIELVDES